MSWLRDNITSILALWWSFAVVGIIFTILTMNIKADDKTTYYIISMVSSISFLMLGYYWGASKSRPAHDSSVVDASQSRNTTIVVDNKKEEPPLEKKE